MVEPAYDSRIVTYGALIANFTNRLRALAPSGSSKRPCVAPVLLG
ncbi:hypothetical protein ACFWFU_04345 [Streptomyces sp. NPDC060235]